MDNCTTPLKRCNKCHRELPATREYFYLHNARPDGFRLPCKECQSGHFGIDRHKREIRDDGLRVCTMCNVPLPATLEYFPPTKVCIDGLHSHCRECTRKYQKERYHADLEKARDIQRQWRKNNLEKTRRAAREYARTHAEQHRENYRRWYKANPDKVRSLAERKRAYRLALPATLTAAEWQACLNWWNGVCAYCGAQQSFWNVLEQEHFIPAINGGGYTADNILPSCKHCNARKHKSNVQEWLTREYGKAKAKRILQKINVYFDSLKDKL